MSADELHQQLNSLSETGDTANSAEVDNTNARNVYADIDMNWSFAQGSLSIRISTVAPLPPEVHPILQQLMQHLTALSNELAVAG